MTLSIRYKINLLLPRNYDDVDHEGAQPDITDGTRPIRSIVATVSPSVPQYSCTSVVSGWSWVQSLDETGYMYTSRLNTQVGFASGASAWVLSDRSSDGMRAK